MTAASGRDISRTLPSEPQGTAGETQNRRRRVARAIAAIALPALLSACADSFVEKHVGPAPLSCENESREAHRWRPGCATHRNIVAAMADPADLYLARQESPRDAVRRDGVISSYAQSRGTAAKAAPASAGPASDRGSQP
jgi:hypothetical protein